jgi:hypothetical protein
MFAHLIFQSVAEEYYQQIDRYLLGELQFSYSIHWYQGTLFIH